MNRDSAEFSRRRFLAALAAVGGTALLRGGPAAAQTAAGARRLDLHHHYESPRWIKWLSTTKRGYAAFQSYTPEKGIEAMDQAGVTTAFASCTEPGVWAGDDFLVERTEAISLAREMNEYGARMVSDHKGRFGLFAVLPLPDIDASLHEIEYAFDTLKADGVGILTSYGNHYIGEPVFQPVLEELNRRRAILYSHPTDGPCCHGFANASPATMEWFTDTARAILSVIQEGPPQPGAQAQAAGQGRGAIPRAPSAATRYPNIQFIWSHGGGSLVGVAHRVVGTVSAADLAGTPAPDSRLHHIRRFYYDTAAVPNPVLMSGLTKLLGGTSQIVFGSDYPFSSMAGTVQGLQTLGFTAEELRGIDHDNAARILPRY